MTDQELLRQYRQSGDADAFAELVGRYAGLVYNTALRVTRRAEDAEDVVQECFISLSCGADTPQSFSTWLHRVAVNKSLNLRRSDSTRRKHEGAAAHENGNRLQQGDSAWPAVASHLDELLEALPDDLREPLILHFLRERTQQEVAEYLSVDQSSVSRRVQTGLERLRESLAKKGVVITGAVLASLMASRARASVPERLIASLTRECIAPISAGAAGGGAAGTIAAVGGLTAVKIKVGLIGLGVLIALIVGGAVVWRSSTGAAPVAPPVSEKSAVAPAAAPSTPDVKPVTAVVPPSAIEAPKAPAAEVALPSNAPAPPTVAAPASDAKADPAEKFIRDAMATVFGLGDPQALADFISPDAERKNNGKGSALTSLAQQPREILNRIQIVDLIFFTQKDVERLSKKYADDMWAPARIPAHLGDGTGCMCVLNVDGVERVGQWVCIAKKIGDRYWIVYIDDN